ncbi:hypothetical protein GCM10027034_23140 [Ramlibacter solisilvae]|uniref:Uncharacterized protein n=1 Tax=Ramlibacter tataouinensis TaxID=94132 RepID=A0A127JPW7_9BURK|nr:hypothetical protein [Ramlibacter tataouinensis]AMO22027.1 hypothetical protein UC35_02990 [Ramlibacter tataouinensis]
MKSPKQSDTGKARNEPEPPPPREDKPGTNAPQSQPDPKAEPIPGRSRTWHPRSPYTTGND